MYAFREILSTSSKLKIKSNGDDTTAICKFNGQATTSPPSRLKNSYSNNNTKVHSNVNSSQNSQAVDRRLDNLLKNESVESKINYHKYSEPKVRKFNIREDASTLKSIQNVITNNEQGLSKCIMAANIFEQNADKQLDHNAVVHTRTNISADNFQIQKKGNKYSAMSNEEEITPFSEILRHKQRFVKTDDMDVSNHHPSISPSDDFCTIPIHSIFNNNRSSLSSEQVPSLSPSNLFELHPSCFVEDNIGTSPPTGGGGANTVASIGSGATVELLQSNLWQKFHLRGTEMIITKIGR